MNFTEVRVFNAYARFSAKIREAVQGQEDGTSIPGKTDRVKNPEAGQDSSRSVYAEPVDTVTISETARRASTAMTAKQEDSGRAPITALRENSPHIELREWMRSGSAVRGGFSYKVPGSLINEALAGRGITVGDDEEYSIDFDVWSSLTVSSKNAEKAKAIQDLLVSTPSGINWGLLLAKLPPG